MHHQLDTANISRESSSPSPLYYRPLFLLYTVCPFGINHVHGSFIQTCPIAFISTRTPSHSIDNLIVPDVRYEYPIKCIPSRIYTHASKPCQNPNPHSNPHCLPVPALCWLSSSSLCSVWCTWFEYIMVNSKKEYVARGIVGRSRKKKRTAHRKMPRKLRLTGNTFKHILWYTSNIPWDGQVAEVNRSLCLK